MKMTSLHTSSADLDADIDDILKKVLRTSFNSSDLKRLSETKQKLLALISDQVKAALQKALDAGYAGDEMGTYDYDRIAEYCIEQVEALSPITTNQLKKGN